MSDQTLVLVDGSYYLFRAYHAIQGLSNSKGEPTGAIYGVINMIKKHLIEGGPDYFAVVFDAKGNTFRNDMYKEYKANRPPMPDDLACQIQPIHDIIRALGIPLMIIDGVEADDVIATLSRQAEEKGIKTIVSTGDKDLAQMVNDKIHLINTMNNLYLDPEGVEKKFGIPPDLIIDYLSLMGDKVDNIPGVPKVGPKTAVKWLKEYGSLDEIIAHADEIKGKVGENLREFLPNFPLTRELVTLKYDVELEFAPDDLVVRTPEENELREYFRYWGFRTWLSELEENEKADSEENFVVPENDNEANYQTILTEDEFEHWLTKLEQAKLISIDTETTSLNYMEANIVGISFAVNKNEAAYLPLAHSYAGAPRQLNIDDCLTKLKPILEDEDLAKIGQNLKYDTAVFANHGIALKGIQHDTMLESYVLNSTASRHDMDSLARKYLGVETIHYEDVAGKGAKQITFDQVSIETASPYAAEDADIVLKLHKVLSKELKQTPSLKKIYDDIEIPLLPVLASVERNGVCIDDTMLLKHAHQMKVRMQEIELEAHDLAGESFNIGSPKQIQDILYDKMELPVLAKTPKGQPSTAENVLQELAADYKLPALILDYRSLSKLCSTYNEKLPEKVNKTTGRLHTSYHQAVTATGRLSSSEPNLQNIPIRTEEGRKIRQAFVARDGYQLVAADYSQIELRIMAHLSEDKGLITAFENGEDIHSVTAAEVFAEPGEEVTAEQRRGAKAINFGLIYGMSAFGLSKALNISRPLAADYIDSYFHKYPGVKLYMERTKELAKEKGYVETFFGRRLYLPGIHSGRSRMAAERAAINAPMQGTAADIMKIAMIEIHEWLAKGKVDARMIMQVHDEVILEVKDQDASKVEQEVSKIMQNAAKLKVPLEVESGLASNWGEAH